MGKLSVILFLLMVLPLSLLQAATLPDPSQSGYSFLRDTYSESSPRSMGMGGVSVIAIEPREAFYNNPAKLADTSDFYFWVPSFNANMYNSLDTITDGTMQKIFDSLWNKKTGNLVEAVSSYLINSKTGRNDFAGFDANVGIIWKGFGLRGDFSENIYTYKPETLSSDEISNYTRFMSAKVSGGYGYKFKFKNDWALNVGASLTFDYLKLKTGNTEHLLNYIFDGGSDIKKFVSNLPDVRGIAFPLNLGATLSFPHNFKIALVSRNLFGKRNMKSLESEQTYSYDINSGVKFDFGLAWIWTKNKVVQVTAEADLKDFTNSFGSTRKLIANVHAGVEVGFFNKIFLRGGLNSGYWTAGAGIWFRAFKLDCAYYFKENGTLAGERAQQCLTIRIALGLM